MSAAHQHPASAAIKVARTSKSAVSRVSKPAAGMAAVGLADLEVGDTAGLETCATKSDGRCLKNLCALASLRLCVEFRHAGAEDGITADEHSSRSERVESPCPAWRWPACFPAPPRIDRHHRSRGRAGCLPRQAGDNRLFCRPFRAWKFFGLVYPGRHCVCPGLFSFGLSALPRQPTTCWRKKVRWPASSSCRRSRRSRTPARSSCCCTRRWAGTCRGNGEWRDVKFERTPGRATFAVEPRMTRMTRMGGN